MVGTGLGRWGLQRGTCWRNSVSNWVMNQLEGDSKEQ